MSATALRAATAAVVLGLCLALPASATVIHGNFVGADVDFNNVRETTQTVGDPEPLFDAPTGVFGNSLLFQPSAFSATAAGGTADSTLALLQTTIVTTSPLFFIDVLQIHEFGDTNLSGTGTAVTRTEVSMSGFVTVTGRNGVPGFYGVVPFAGVITPADPFTLPSDPGLTLWSGSVVLDIATFTGFNDITSIDLSFNNQLDAFSEANSSATIQKKVVPGPTIIISIPEPALAPMLGLALAGLLLARRRGL